MHKIKKIGIELKYTKHRKPKEPYMKVKSRTDLAIEHHSLTEIRDTEDFTHSQIYEDGIRTDIVKILTPIGEKTLSRPIGEYVTLTFRNLPPDSLADAVKKHLVRLLPPNCQKILTVGLGNREITADAIGPYTVDRITVTGHLEAYGGIGHYAISPSVLGKTGIESFTLIKSALEASKADAVIVIDALAAESLSRLYQTVQIGSTGIVPGSGVGNHRHAIDEKTLGVRVIAIGVPTVVSSATLFRDTLEKTGRAELLDSLEDDLAKIEPYFVTPPDADVDTDRLAVLLAQAINTL